MPKVTITVSGAPCTGKSVIKYQIARYLEELGLEVAVVENELTKKAIEDRKLRPSKYLIAMAQKGITFEVEEKPLARSAIS